MTNIYNLFLNSSGCADIACLRNASSDTIIAANQDLFFNYPSEGWIGPSIGYGPIPDGDLVPDAPDRLLAEGNYHKEVAKVMAANMANDGYYAVVSEF